MVNIIKKLHIESKDQLYKLVDQNEELSENILFIPFMDSMKDHYWGCRCEEVRFNEVSDAEYYKLNTQEVLNLLKDFFNCDIVTFIK